MLTDTPLIDWITLTTFDKMTFVKWEVKHLQIDQPGIDYKIRGYQGLSKGAYFLGVGEQNKKSHAMLRVSGSDSHKAFYEFYNNVSVKCTRIDLQITIELPENYSARILTDDLREVIKNKNIAIVENTDKLDTIYIGSRKSDRFCRIYVKEIDKNLYLRFEVEFKGCWAGTVSKALFENMPVSPILNSYLDTMNCNDSQGIIKLIKSKLADFDSGLANPKIMRDNNKTYNWLIETVTPSIIRILNDHDYGPYLKQHLIDIIAENTIDK